MPEDKPQDAVKHPTLLPQLAWQALIKDIMAEHGFKRQNAFAEAIDVCEQTIGRWLSAKPSVPTPASFDKVAAFLEISGDELAKRWFWFMGEPFGYRHQDAEANEIREPAATYGEPDPLLEAKTLDQLDLKDVPMVQRLPAHHLRRDILEYAADLEDTRQRSILRLRSMIKNLRAFFHGAADTERKLQGR